MRKITNNDSSTVFLTHLNREGFVIGQPMKTKEKKLIMGAS